MPDLALLVGDGDGDVNVNGNGNGNGNEGRIHPGYAEGARAK